MRNESDLVAMYEFIVMYTISNKDLRDAFREQIQKQQDVEQLNESAYSFYATSISDAREKIQSCFNNIDKIVRKQLLDGDFIDIYCSGHRANCNIKKEIESICRYHVPVEK